MKILKFTTRFLKKKVLSSDGGRKLKELSYPSDMISVDFQKVQSLFKDRNINFYHLLKNPQIPLKIPKEFSVESDNNFWGNIDTSCSMGAFSYTSSRLNFGITVGRYCSIARNVKVMGAEHFPDWISTSPVFYEKDYNTLSPADITHNKRQARKLIIGNDVWIGQDVVLKPTIKIGNGAIIASNSVVTKDVPAFAIVGGIPAKVIRYRFDPSLILEVEDLCWWRYHKADLKNLKANQPKEFVKLLSKRVDEGVIKEYSPTLLLAKDLQ